MRRVLGWLLGWDEPTRLEALRILERAEVIRPEPPKRIVRYLNLRLVRDARRRVA